MAGADLSFEEEQRVLAGGVPGSAQARLAELRARGMASSFFTVGEFAVAAQHGIEVVGQLVGASACRLAVGVVRRTRGPVGRLPLGSPAWREHSGPIQSWTTARQRALARLSEQAEQLQADGVLGVRARYGVQEGEPPVVEVVFTGTAVRLGGERVRRQTKPVLGLVSPQEFSLLRAVGVEVAGIVGSCSAVEVAAGLSTRRALSGRLAGLGNQELTDVTEGIYEARRLAIERLHADAAKLGASGVIGVDLPRSLQHDSIRAPEVRLMVHLLGTAVRGRPRRQLNPMVVLDVADE